MTPHIELLPAFQDRTAHLDIELSESRQEHWYRADGIPDPMPSVTTILHVINKSDILMPWAARMTSRHIISAIRTMTVPRFRDKGHLLNWLDPVLRDAQNYHRRFTDEAADIGTENHEAVEMHLLGKWTMEEIHHEKRYAVQGALQFLEDYKLTAIYPEFCSWNEDELYAGTIDCPAIDKNGDLVVVDWKTSGDLYPDYDYQVAAYAKNLEHMTGQKVSEAYTVRLPKRAPWQIPYEKRRIEDVPGKYQTFLNAFRLWKDLSGYYQ